VAPTFTGAGVPLAPWKTRVQLLSRRKDENQGTREGGVPLSLRMWARVVMSTLSNPALKSKNRDETLCCSVCRVLMSLKRVRDSSQVLSQGRDPHCLGFSSPLDRAPRKKLDAIIHSTIFKNVRMRTIILNEQGDW